MNTVERHAEREEMVRRQIYGRGITNPRLLDVLLQVPRHQFIPPATDAWHRAYQDAAQAIGEGQTISQPYIVALMTDALRFTGVEKVLEIGAGSGYQTAILCGMAREVVAVERISTLAARARRALDAIGASNYRLYTGDGSVGWPADAPYDAILVAAVAPEVPPALVEQLAPGGRMVLPVGPEGQGQRLLVLNKDLAGGVATRDLGEVAFVPLIGASGFGLPDDLGEMDI